MACVADRLIAAPFAIVGSIGVLAQLPNFHRLLEEKGVDFEQVMAGRYKRTLTMFGKNTDEGREKLQQEVEDIHELFKAQIREHRPQVDVERVATGEHWYGIRALELKLVDELQDQRRLPARELRRITTSTTSPTSADGAGRSASSAAPRACLRADGLCRRADPGLGRLRHTAPRHPRTTTTNEDESPLGRGASAALLARA